MLGVRRNLKVKEHGEGCLLRHGLVSSASGLASIMSLQMWEKIWITQEEHYLKSLNSLDLKVLNSTNSGNISGMTFQSVKN